MHLLQSEHPGTPAIELGTRGEVLAKVGWDELDFESACRVIGRGGEARFLGAMPSAHPRG